MNGQRLATYLTIQDAAKAIGIRSANITSAIQGKVRSAGGFYWEKGIGPAKVDLGGYEYGNALRAKNRQRKIKQYSPDGSYLKSFDSIKDAAKTAGISATTITGALRGKQQTAGGVNGNIRIKKGIIKSDIM